MASFTAALTSDTLRALKKAAIMLNAGMIIQDKGSSEFSEYIIPTRGFIFHIYIAVFAFLKCKVTKSLTDSKITRAGATDKKMCWKTEVAHK